MADSDIDALLRAVEYLRAAVVSQQAQLSLMQDQLVWLRLVVLGDDEGGEEPEISH